jgi:hypothetical protein
LLDLEQVGTRLPAQKFNHSPTGDCSLVFRKVHTTANSLEIEIPTPVPRIVLQLAGKKWYSKRFASCPTRHTGHIRPQGYVA